MAKRQRKGGLGFKVEFGYAMGNDGTLGCKLMKQRGASIIAQNEDSCVVYGMPKSIADEGLADAVVPLNHIAAAIVRFVARSPSVRVPA